MKTHSLLSTLLLLAPAAVLGSGTVLDVDGNVTIDRAGQQITAARATELRTGDTLKVGPMAKARVQFEDDSIFAIPGPATFHVDQFQMPTGKVGGRAVYTLKEGGLRTITGSISKGKNDRYEMHTEEATITVAGSGYSSIRCAGACASKFKAGLYVRGESGVITVVNDGGRIRLNPGQVAYVKDKGTAPAATPKSPFAEPQFAGEFELDTRIEGEAHPPRIEQERPASPS